MNDLKINGSGIIGGGSFQNVSINGSCKILDEIVCERFSVNGSTKTSKNIMANEFICRGSVLINGALSTKTCDVRGALTVVSNISSKKTIIKGKLVAKDINSDDFELKSNESILQNINANNVQIIGKWCLFYHRHNQVDRIEADVINVSYLKAKHLVGDKVTIGPHSIIEFVQYRNEYTANSSSKVGRVERI